MKILALVLIALLSGCATQQAQRVNLFEEGTNFHLPLGVVPNERDLEFISSALEDPTNNKSTIWFTEREGVKIPVEVVPTRTFGDGKCREFTISPVVPDSESFRVYRSACKNEDGKWDMIHEAGVGVAPRRVQRLHQ